ncbi:hypothetical protein EYF80_004406 [Liparis tanakae]|uniref:Uncharacterized protein n=1 Tax=Liparis tanakae TaxID=230148 RepID=A0A4Z2J690_9TELE|nr:hypothetical protein EYF80_004406 [Liparis tanakae]
MDDIEGNVGTFLPQESDGADEPQLGEAAVRAPRMMQPHSTAARDQPAQRHQPAQAHTSIRTPQPP